MNTWCFYKYKASILQSCFNTRSKGITVSFQKIFFKEFALFRTCWLLSIFQHTDFKYIKHKNLLAFWWSEVAQSCPTLCDPTDCSPSGSSVHGISQARVLEWVAISFSRGSSPPRDWTQVSCTAGRLSHRPIKCLHFSFY